jgi:hypothetical protein
MSEQSERIMSNVGVSERSEDQLIPAPPQAVPS